MKTVCRATLVTLLLTAIIILLVAVSRSETFMANWPVLSVLLQAMKKISFLEAAGCFYAFLFIDYLLISGFDRERGLSEEVSEGRVIS